MKTQQLNYFISVAKHLNFTEAADENFVSQPAISRQIDKLEAYLGCKLLNRNTHGVSLTEAGEEFLEYAKNTVAEENAIMKRMSQIEHSRTGKITIACLFDGTQIIASVLESVSQKVPQFIFSINQFTGRDFGKALRSASHDFYFGFVESLQGLGNFRYIEINTISMVIYGHEKYGSMIRELDWARLQEVPFLIFQPSVGPILYDSIIQICKKAGFEPNISAYYNSLEATLIGANSGLGITIIPNSVLNSLPSHMVLKEVPGSEAAFRSMIAWQDGVMSSAKKQFLDLVLDYFKDSPILTSVTTNCFK